MSSESDLNNNEEDHSYYPQGSEWRLWDLHVHSPASFFWNGTKFNGEEDHDNELVDKMIEAMNTSEVSVFALMDYWTFDGWLKLQKRLAMPDAPTLNKTVFPGIELRLSAPMKGRLNAHVIFSDDINHQYLNDFLSTLRLELIDSPLSQNSLREYARKCGADHLETRGFQKLDVDQDDEVALQAGNKIAELKVESYKKAISEIPDGLGLGFMPFTTSDGLTQIERNKHYAYVLTLFQNSPIFETRDSDTWASFAGVETEDNSGFLKNFQSALNNVPRLAVSGSDAHKFYSESERSSIRGYGMYPSNAKTWLKADPTWLGLKQVIKEPAKRSFIGEIPPKLDYTTANKTFYIDTIEISKTKNHAGADWFDGQSIQLNKDLVAIIGNKGSGKSALADIIALLGNSRQTKYFSFLKKGRFRGRNGEPSINYKGVLSWLDQSRNEIVLSENPQDDKVELVRYIPQGRFEDLCNAHVSGESDAFETELRSVIFSHISESKRGDAFDFDELIANEEKSFRAELSEKRRLLTNLNQEISIIEKQLHPSAKRKLEEQLSVTAKQLDEHNLVKPSEVIQPTGQSSPEQDETNKKLAETKIVINGTERRLTRIQNILNAIARRQLSANNVSSQLDILSGQYQAFEVSVEPELESLGLNIGSVIKLKIFHENLDKIKSTLIDKKLKYELKQTEIIGLLQEQKAFYEKTSLELKGPQLLYQKYLEDLSKWTQQKEKIEGSKDAPESLLGLKEQLSKISKLPEQLTQLRGARTVLSGDIFDIVDRQRNSRAMLFAPLQKVVEENKLIKDNYKLEFMAFLDASHNTFSETLFSIVKQSIGQIRGDQGHNRISELFEKYDVSNKVDMVNLIEEVHELIEDAAKQSINGTFGVQAVLRKERTTEEVYDYIYGLNYLSPKYTLLFQETPIEQLSPGQRGALLLIFYLLVDKGRNPIVLDQPEENLDNETVVSLLVPVLNKAKETRQIFMVTHNPNLAVVCDAEQIIYASFDRKSGPKIAYKTGSIENPEVNKLVVDVLEGTIIAFKNREGKYH